MYRVNGREFHINKSHYLLTNAFTHGEVTIDSRQYVHGICIELSPGLLSEVAAICHDPASPYPQKDFYDFLTTADFFENVYFAANTRLGRYLQHTTEGLSMNSFTETLFAEEFFYGLAEKMMADQEEIYRYFRSFDAVKGSTRKDLLGRLMKGKAFMDDNYTDKISIADTAGIATMSEYYFLRLFKQIFHCSPHQYILNRRLQKARLLLKAGDEPVMNIAYSCGFADIYSFSKAFRKKFGGSPGVVRKANCQ